MLRTIQRELGTIRTAFNASLLHDALEANHLGPERGALRHGLIHGLEVIQRVQNTLAEQNDDGDREYCENANSAPATSTLDNRRFEWA
jgi:hypothetical protein